MVFWVVSRAPASTGGRSCFGPYESEVVARRALAELRARFLITTAGVFEVILDYA